MFLNLRHDQKERFTKGKNRAAAVFKSMKHNEHEQMSTLCTFRLDNGWGKQYWKENVKKR